MVATPLMVDVMVTFEPETVASIGASVVELILVASAVARLEAVSEQHPGLDEHVIGGDPAVGGREDLLRARVAAVATISRRVPDRRIDEEAHRRLAVGHARPG